MNIFFSKSNNNTWDYLNSEIMQLVQCGILINYFQPLHDIIYHWEIFVY